MSHRKALPTLPLENAETEKAAVETNSPPKLHFGKCYGSHLATFPASPCQPSQETQGRGRGFVTILHISWKGTGLKFVAPDQV